MIKLNETSKREIWVNPKNICLLYKTENGTTAIGTAFHNYTIYVHETPEEVLRLMKEGNRENN